jgi:hypothetical protein
VLCFRAWVLKLCRPTGSVEQAPPTPMSLLLPEPDGLLAAELLAAAQQRYRIAEA